MFSLLLSALLLWDVGSALLFEPDPCPVVDQSLCTCAGLTVRCSARGLTSVPQFLQTGRRYSYLDLSDNNITSLGDLDFLNISVSTLDLSGNPLASSFSHNAFSPLRDVLVSLSLSRAHLPALPPALQALQRIKTLSADHNERLTALDTDVMTSLGVTLENFDVSNTGISTWPAYALKGAIRLKSLRMSGNKMTSVPDDAFLPFAATLTSLDLSYNQLRAFPSAVGSLRVLRTLDLSFNALGDIPAGQFGNCINTLHVLHLVHVYLRSVPYGLRELATLRELYLSYNPINSAEVDVFNGSISASLQTLHLDHTLLQEVPQAINGLVSLRELNFTWNRVHVIDSFDFINLWQLQTLYLDKNPLTNVKFASFTGLTSLTHLYIRNTTLTFVPNAALGEVKGLQVVDLSFNRIEALYDYGFPTMSGLREVYLAGNPLANVSSRALDDLTGTQVLDLSGCKLSNIPRAVQSMPRLRTLKMEGNPVPCSCGALGWVQGWRDTQGLIATVTGHCNNSSSALIQDFILNDVPSC